jgi:hypothetical protein
MNSRALLV